MSATTTLATPQARICRLWLQITDDQARTAHYNVVPDHAAGGYLAAYRLTKLSSAVGAATARYFVSLTHEGTLSCSCPGFRDHRTCKHIASMQAAGILPLAEIALYLRGLKLELEQQRGDNQNGPASTRAPLAPKAPRRPRKKSVLAMPLIADQPEPPDRPAA